MKKNNNRFLPMTVSEMRNLGWNCLDFVLISGDAYVDHPSFGAAIIARLIESMGYRIGIIAQPDWRKKDDFIRFGRPRIAALVTAGNMDSMLNHYTASGKKRRLDNYSPDGVAGLRPDRATIVYCNRVRELWKDIPLIIGGIEASLRRLAHYDFWSNTVRRSLLADSRADLLLYGMAEKALREVVNRLSTGEQLSLIKNVRGTCWKTHCRDEIESVVELPSYNSVQSDKGMFAKAYRDFYKEQDPLRGKALIQDQGSWLVVQNPPPIPLTQQEMDAVYALPYARAPHPYYNGHRIPAVDEVEFSLVSHRGCMGECSFCALSSHQGRIVQSRSIESILSEAELLVHSPKFKGYIHDVGGPTANFRELACPVQKKGTACGDKSCMFPHVCHKMTPTHREYRKLLNLLRDIKGVKKVFIRSGIRYDYLLADTEWEVFLEELCRNHISGQLKIAPEHISRNVLKYMNKPQAAVYEKFSKVYRKLNDKLKLKQYLVPYFMCGHPGCGLNESIELAEFIRDTHIRPEQVQIFTPTPGTRSTCMYYTGVDPISGDRVYIPNVEEMKIQKALLQYWIPENWNEVYKALKKTGRMDLVGHASKCLIAPKKPYTQKNR